MDIKDIARICHEANRVYCMTHGDHSHLCWWDSSDHIKDSVIEGVRKAVLSPNLTVETSHRSWVAFKQAAGWEYGEEKSAENKTHPCMVEYDELPADQKCKDAMFLAIVNALKESVE